MPFAHSKNSKGQRHDLVAHLRAVAKDSSLFASPFNASKLAYYVALWHDNGKFDPAFQQYLFDCETGKSKRGQGPDHKAAGTKLALQHLGPVALLIQGHHGGLRTLTDLKSWLGDKGNQPGVEAALSLARQAIPDLEPVGHLSPPNHLLKDQLAVEFFLRMLFSTLVDADFLDTERHFYSDQAAQRGTTATLSSLWLKFIKGQESLTGKSGQVNQIRHEVYQACLTAANQEHGFFRLSVPTGGGKTLSGLGFALRHALRHNLARVIIAVPFTTITEQTAKAYRDTFASDEEDVHSPVVLEHHSAAITDKEDEEGNFHLNKEWSRLASENWDAPIVVTTTVQLFESMFANSTSRCRKLHRLSNSVIILDEAQALPTHLLTPILQGLKQLVANYHTSVVISTATQPAFDTIPSFQEIKAREIVPNPARYFNILKRVEYDWQLDEAMDWPVIAELMRQKDQTLAILNVKRHAHALLDALGADEAISHLSSSLCAAHRRQVVNEVKQRLKYGKPCWLVSTQVVEAGVDLDFPLVLRSIGPLDSIVQAAGRCNREGRLPQLGKLIVFRPIDSGMPLGTYHTAEKITSVLRNAGKLDDPNDPAVFKTYYKLLFETIDLDREGIQKLQTIMNYPEVNQKFKMIDEDTQGVVIDKYGNEEEQGLVRRIIDRLRRGGPDPRVLLRQLQPYIVSIRSSEARRYTQYGLIQEIIPSLGAWLGDYDSVRGLTIEDRFALDRLVV